MQIGRVNIAELQEQVINLSFQVRRIGLLLEWLNAKNGSMCWPAASEMRILEQKALHATAQQYGNDLDIETDGVRGSDLLGQLERAWGEMTLEMLRRGKMSGVDVSFGSGPLNEVIVYGASDLQPPHKLAMEAIAQKYGYFVTFA